MNHAANERAVEVRRSLFRAGDRVRAEGFAPGSIDDNTSVPRGTEGRVISVDALGTVHVAWDNGSTLGVLLEDSLKLLD